MNHPKATPMMRQYLSIKGKYPDTLLFYRMGDFYEMFFEDAEIASRALEIALTSRNKREPSPIPMCGVPVRSVKGYVVRLIEQGYKVAICEQIGDPAKTKGLVEREVVRVITPGMILDDEYLDQKSNNFVLAIYQEGNSAGLSYLDISTGTFRVTESKDPAAVLEESRRVGPSEVLLPESFKANRQDGFRMQVNEAFSQQFVTFLDEKAFEHRRGRELLLDQFKTISLEGFGCEHLKAGISAAGAVLYYVREAQKQPLIHVIRIETYTLHNYLWLDDTSCRNLELLQNIRTGSRAGTLFSVIDRTVTAMGARRLKQWLRYPLMAVDAIEARFDAVDEAKANLQERQAIRELLKNISDLERLGGKIAMGQSNARDLVALKRSLQLLPQIWTVLSRFEARLLQPPFDPQNLYALADRIEKAIREDARPTIHEGGIIKEGFNAELDELIHMSRDGKSWLAKLESQEKARTGIGSLKVSYNRVFGYYIEVSKTHSHSVPDYYVRKQTLVNAERYITDELKKYEQKVLGAEERRAALEYAIFNEIRAEIVMHNPGIQQAAQFLARLDCLTNLAEVSDHNDYHRPRINTEGHILIEEGRHPVVEKMISGERFVPNTIKLDNAENQILIITGPNMAGKSTILRQVALSVLLAQMGAFIPAKKASISVTDRIFTRVGALDNLSQGRSTFMVEMEETANILNNATEQSLVIMDEIGRGTSTYDGLSIAWAVAEYLHDLKGKGVKTLFATHYHELTGLARLKPRLKNYNIAVKEWNDEIIFLRKLVQGGTNRSYGIQVARLAGIPVEVIQQAKQILFQIENQEIHHLPGVATTDAEKKETLKDQVQLDLFCQPEQWIIEKLKQMDISEMTPLEALNCLNELKQKVRH